MKAILSVVLVIGVSVSAHQAHAACSQTNCDDRKNPGSCDRARAAYDACENAEAKKRAPAKPVQPPKQTGEQKTVPKPAVSDCKGKGACAGAAR